MEKPTDFTHKRESTATPYSELGKSEGTEKLSKDQWGVFEQDGNLVLFYSDPKLIKDDFTSRIAKNLKEGGVSPEQQIKIADFGGGDGVMLDAITKQIAEYGYQNILGINIDFEDRWLDIMKSKFINRDEKNSRIKLEGVRGNLTQIPLEPESIDAACSRFALQYISKDKQSEAIKEMLRTLKPGAQLIIEWPNASETKEQSSFLDEFDVNVDSIITGMPIDQVKGKRHFPSIEEMEEIASGLNLSHHDIKIMENITAFMSTDIYANRFNITDEKKLLELGNLFNDPYFRNKSKELKALDFVAENGKTYVGYKIGIATLVK